MSTGNKPIEIQLNDSKITVVKGANGNGKSVLLYALYYGLYGKPFSGVKLGSLVNSINKKFVFSCSHWVSVKIRKQ